MQKIYAMHQGDLITVFNVVETEGKKIIRFNKKTKRGAIKKFSKQSKKRLTFLLAKLKKVKLYFVTLTYAENMMDMRRAKSDLDNLGRMISRDCPGIWFIWKLEFQKRGSIHYHLLLSGASYALVKTLIKKRWKKGFIHVKTAKKEDQIYFCKYISKDQLEIPVENTGRFWGVFNKIAVDIESPKMYYINQTLKEFLGMVIKNKGLSTFNSKIHIFSNRKELIKCTYV